MIDEINYTVSVPTNSIDSVVNQWSKLINYNLLIIGDETGKFSTLINYGSIKEMPYEIDSGSENIVAKEWLATINKGKE